MPINVNQPTPAVLAMQPDLEKVDALMGGTAAMRAAGAKYLPKWPMEQADSYDFRLKTSTLFNAFARTVDNMTGKPFSEDMTWTDIDPLIEQWFENIDLAGRSFQSFAKEVFCRGICDGLTHVFVDCQVAVDKDGNAIHKTQAEEQRAGVRPYLVSIRQSQILGWMSQIAGGKEVLTQLRYLEVVQEPDGDFGVKAVNQVRVLLPGEWRTYRENADKTAWVETDRGVTTVDFIPVVTYYARRTGFMTGKSPLIDLADLNIKHWQSSSDQDSILHVARVPILAIIGVEDSSKIEIGAKAALMLPIDGDAKYVEHKGEAIGAGRDSLKDLEGQMESMGAELLTKSIVAKTATEDVIDASSATCQLAAMVQSLEGALDQIVDMMAAWVNKPQQGDIDIFDDFATLAVNASTAGQYVAALISLVEIGLLSKESAFNEMRRAGIVNPDLVWEDESKKIPKMDPVKPTEMVVT